MNVRACMHLGRIPLLGSPSPQPSPASGRGGRRNVLSFSSLASARRGRKIGFSCSLSRFAGEGRGEGSEGSGRANNQIYLGQERNSVF